MDTQHEQFARLLLEGDEEQAVDYTNSLLKNLTKLQAYENVITPAMYYIGELWEKNVITVADEHLATAVCDYVLSRMETDLKHSPQGRSVGKVMLFGVEDEQHYIGIKMTAEVFRDQGWKVRYLGPNLPVEHSMKQVNQNKPDVIGVSAALSYRLPVLKKMVKRFEQLSWKPFIMIGGRMARQLDLNEFESDRVMVVKGLDHLNLWFREGREKVIDETS